MQISQRKIDFLLGFPGLLGFLLNGNYKCIQEPLTIGFINIPAFLIYTPITIIMAKLGAKTVHKIDKTIITKLFGLLKSSIKDQEFKTKN